jgi:hypothetical protein
MLLTLPNQSLMETCHMKVDGFKSMKTTTTTDLDSPEDKKRQLELEALQAGLVPQFVFLAHNVFLETATWMKAMLENGEPVAGKDCKEVQRSLDNVEDVSPVTPLYWLMHAHDLAIKVVAASEEHGIYDVFGEEDLKHFLDLMVDIKIRALEVAAPRVDYKSTSQQHLAGLINIIMLYAALMVDLFYNSIYAGLPLHSES